MLVRQGEPGTDVYLLLDGVIRVERDGERLAEYGPGAMLGERAHLEGGTRTSTLVAVTPCRVASVDADQFDRQALEELSGGHRREDAGRSGARHRIDGVRLYLCGVRGSTPAPGADFLRYGGHTSCVAIAHDDAARPTLVLDAGTGLRQVTPLLGGQPFDGTILLTHLHWDHVHGLPFFTGGRPRGIAGQPAAARAGGRRQRGAGAGQGHVAAALPDRAGRACAAPGPSARSRPGR